MNRIVRGDILRFVAHYRGPLFHSLLSDPPYELGFMGKAFDKTGISFRSETWSALGELMLPGAFGMSFASARGWHRLAVAIEDAGLIIHPSIFMMGFSYGSGFPKATRIDTQVDKSAGRIGENVIELKRKIRERYEATGLTLSQFNDACGFEASGYLRESSTWANVLPSQEKWRAMRTVLGCGNSEMEEELNRRFTEAEREVMGKSDAGLHRGSGTTVAFGEGNSHEPVDITAPATLLAQTWAGHRYGLQALKPALEPIIVFQKPYQGKPVESITKTGAGALWIDGARISTTAIERDGMLEMSKGFVGRKWGRPEMANYGYEDSMPTKTLSEPHLSGRWPANFVLQHSPECVRVGTKRVNGNGAFPKRHGSSMFVQPEERFERIEMSDSDGLEAVDDWRCVEGCPVKALNEQTGPLTSGIMRAGTKRSTDGGYHGDFPEVANLRDTYGDSGNASRFFFNADWSYEIAEQLANADPVRYAAKSNRRERDAGLESVEPQKRDTSRHDYQPSMNDGEGNPYNRGVIPVRNNHPTIKPISLNKWLATLLLPPEEYAPRRILVPFAGAGSEMIGAMLAGWDEIVGVEKESEYVELAKARLGWWGDLVKWGHTDIDAMLRQWNIEESDSDESDVDGWSQLDMFG